MSGRRAARIARVKPNKVPGRQFEEIREVDPDGKIVVHHRLVDTLGRMLKSGTIDQAMHDARSAPGAAGPARPRHRARAGAQRAPATCSATCSRRRGSRWPRWTSSPGTSATVQTLLLETIDNLEHKM